MSVTGRLAYAYSMANHVHNSVIEETEISDFTSDEELNFDIEAECLTFTCSISNYNAFTGDLHISYQTEDEELTKIYVVLKKSDTIDDECVQKVFDVEDVHDPVYKRVSVVIKMAIELLTV